MGDLVSPKLQYKKFSSGIQQFRFLSSIISHEIYFLILNFSSCVEKMFHSFALFQHSKRNSVPRGSQVISCIFFSVGILDRIRAGCMNIWDLQLLFLQLWISG